MSSTNLVRWSGAALILGGILGAVAYLFHPLNPDFGAMQSTRWVMVHGLTGVAFLLIIPGLVGLYAHIAEESGVLGLAGFLLALLGSALTAGLLLLIECILLPVAASNPAFTVLADPANAVYSGTLALPLFLVTSVLFAVGFVLLGITVLRTSSLPSVTGYLIIAGGILFAVPVPPAPVIINTIGMFLLGVGLASVGYALWTTVGQRVAGSKAALGTVS